MKKKTIQLFFVASLFSFFGLNALRTNPLVGRSVWRVQRDSLFVPIEESDAVGGIIDINVAGNYQLYEDLTDKEIIISVDGVCFDLNGYELASTTVSPIVSVDASNVKIFNGKIRDITTVTNTGILIGAGQSNVLIERVVVFDCAEGILFDGQEGSEVTDCEVLSCDLVGNTIGMSLQNADENHVRNCSSTYSKTEGFKLVWSENNVFQDCSVLKTVGDASVSGFQTEGGKDNLFDHCIVKETITTAEDFCNKSHGFLLTGTEEKTKIIDCIVNDTGMLSTMSAVSYGIQISPDILEDSELLSWTTGLNAQITVTCLVWSPDTKHIVAGQDNRVSLYLFDGTCIDQTTYASLADNVVSTDWSPDGKFFALASGDTLSVYSFGGYNGGLVLIDSHTVGGEEIFSVSWSPDGKYIVTGWADSKLRVYSFDGTTEKSLLINYYSDGATNKTLHLVCLKEVFQEELAPELNIISVDWSPDGKYVAWGSHRSFMGVVKFDGGELAEFGQLGGGGGPFGFLSKLYVEWSPTGRFVAVGESYSNLQDGYVHVVAYFPSWSTKLIDVDSISLGDPVPSVSWSPDGKYIACCHSEYLNLPNLVPATPSISVLSFDGDTLSILKTITQPPYPTGNAPINVIDWSACGKYICSGGTLYTWPDPFPADRAFLEVFNSMTCPEYCLVKNCSVADTQAYDEFMGTGIAGGGSSCFLNNTCCNNDVDFNYGVPNVFFGDHNDRRPFDNWATQATSLGSSATPTVDAGCGWHMAMA